MTAKGYLVLLLGLLAGTVLLVTTVTSALGLAYVLTNDPSTTKGAGTLGAMFGVCVLLWVVVLVGLRRRARAERADRAGAQRQ